MKLLRRLFDPKRTANLVVYAVTAVVDGNVKASPFGKAPRFPLSFENKIRKENNPAEASYVNSEIAGSSVIMFWTNGGIDAICFIDKDMIGTIPSYTPLSPNVLLQIDADLRHFPRPANS